ncbi:natterin-3-like [Chanos chanos]|uniref:Natterin-3-like n=1 Tax=Chanos chanos TaxID=29144 RepID=A0A6J2WTW4_CHACN|nr:natterin-3-like [Chanos chanos]
MRASLTLLWSVLQLCVSAVLSNSVLAVSHTKGKNHAPDKPKLNLGLEEIVPPLDAWTPVVWPEAPPELVEVQADSSPFMFEEHASLKWVSWNGSLPSGAVGIYNGYTERMDYVCKFNCEAGFYTPSRGNYCQYPYGDAEYSAPKFEILVNQDHFEFLEWKEDSYGSVPPNSVKTCPRAGIYVGKNKYGLGKVVPEHEAFFLPWEGDEYWYKKYHVLTINTDVYHQHISHVQYNIDQIELFHYPPETIQMAKASNFECHSIEKTVLLEKSSTVEKTWNIGRETQNGSTSTMEAKIPILNPDKVDFSEKEQTVSFSEGTTMVESMTHSMSVQILVPPNHSCRVRMDARRMTADIPFTARLSRTYNNGDTHWTTVTGTYDGVKIGEIDAVVERCQPIPDAPPCSPEMD